MVQTIATQPWPAWVGLYGGCTILILSVGLYDLVTRRRLHPAWLAGLAWTLLMELVALGLYVTPAWKALAAKIIAAA